MRIGYFGLLSVFVLMYWFGMTYRGSMSGAYRTSQMAEMGMTIVACIQWFQFLTLPLISLVMLSGSIGDEIYRRSLGVLMTTPITSLQIVLGKLASRLVQMLLLLATSLPLLAVVRVFGGVPWDYVVSGLCITLTATLFAGAVSLWFSISGRRVYLAVIKTVVALGILYVLFPLVLWAVGYYIHEAQAGEGPLQNVAFLRDFPNWEHVLVSIAYFSNPYIAMVTATEEAFSAGGRSWLPFAGMGWTVHCGIMAGMSAVLVLLAVWRVRRVALAEITGDTPQARRKARRAARTDAAAEADPARVRRLFGPPMIWKELQVRIARSRLRMLLVAAFTMAVLGLTYAVAGEGLDGHVIHSIYVVIFMLLGMLVTTVVAATGITTEKEAGTWEPLLGTALSSRQIVIGKAVGAIGRSLPVWLLLAFHLVLMMGLGYVHPIVLVHLGMLVAGLVAMLTGTGLFFSVCFKRTTFAVALALCLAIFLWALLPMPFFMLDAMSFSRATHLGELCSTVHPLVQAVVVTDAATGDLAHQPLSALTYNWPMWLWTGPSAGILATTGIVLATMLGHVGVGVAFLALTGYLVRRMNR